MLVYWLPGGRRSPEELGLIFPTAFGGLSAVSIGEHQTGPPGCEGAHGCLYARAGGAPLIATTPEAFEWGPVPGVADGRVGRLKGAAVGPDELLRPDALEPGELVRLEDGELWKIPHALVWAGAYVPGVPTVLQVDASGNWSGSRPVDKYAELWRLASALLDVEMEAARAAAEEGVETWSFEFPDMDRLCMAALSANYFAGAAEASLLGLYSGRVRSAISSAVLDWGTFAAWSAGQKKTAAAGSGSANGADESTPAPVSTV